MFLQTFLRNRYHWLRPIKLLNKSNSHRKKGIRLQSDAQSRPRPIALAKFPDYKKIDEQQFSVNSGFGKLILNSKCSCFIKPMDVQEHPNADYACISIWGVEKAKTELKISAEVQGEDEDILNVELYPDVSDAFCSVHIPIQYEVDATLEGNADIHIEGLDCDCIDVITQGGSIQTKNVKSKEVSFSTNSGNITTVGVLQGSVNINAKRTKIKATRLQGVNFNIQAGELHTEIESSYVDNGSIFANSGEVNIRHLHGSTDLHLETGKININGLHGCLNAVLNEGDAELHVSEITKDSFIQVNEGSLNLSLSDPSRETFNVTAPTLDISPDIKTLGKESQRTDQITFKTTSQSSPSLQAFVNIGSVKVIVKDWFSSLGIRNGS